MEPTYSAKRSHRKTSRSPPQYNDNYQTTYKRQSPINQSKSPNNNGQQKQIQDDEEQRYEERRSEELRRQIREREAELEKISQSKDRLKLRIQNSLSFGGSGQNFNQVIKQSQNSALNQTKTSPLRQSALSGHSSILKQSVQIHKDSLDTANKRNTPRSFKFKHMESPSSMTDMHAQQSINVSQRHSVANLNPVKNEYVQQIQNDNQQLQRRLNLVVAELDRVTRENNMQQQNLFSVQNEAEQYMRAIQNEEKVDVLQQDIQEEIFIQKESNKQQEKRLQEIDIQRSETLKKLNLLQEERERQVFNSENLSKGLTTKLQITQDIEFQIQQNKEKQELISAQLRNVEWEVKNSNSKLPELNLITDKLRRERDELLMKLRQLNENYEFAVSDISKERAKIETHNRRHLQLLGSKAVFMALHSMIESRKQQSLNEFYNYCRFDQNCHRTLTQLSIIIQNCGQYQMKNALQKWFQNALKPKQTRLQGTYLIDRLYKMKLRQRMFKKWYNKVYRQKMVNAGKTLAVKKIWEIKVQDVNKDVCRAFTIWRDKMKHQLQQIKALKYLIARQKTNRLREVLITWQGYSTEVDYAIKHHVLRTQFTSSNLSLIAFSQLRVQCAYKKRIRLMRLAHLLKAWKDSNAYRKHMMAQNVTCSHMRKLLNQRLLSACFEAIRLNKENEKYELMQQSLNGNYEPSMRQLEESIKQRAAQALKLKKHRALCALSKQVECKVASYFNHWKIVEQHIQIKIKTNLKELVERLYRQATHQAFTSWKNGQMFLQRQQQNDTIQDLARGGKKLSQDVDSTTKTVTLERMRQQKNARTGLVRASEICVRRYLTYGLRQWHNKCRQMTAMEQVGAGTVIKKLRKYLIQQYFNRYRKQVQIQKKEELAWARCDHYLKTRNLRKIRQIYNAICQYTNMFCYAKKNQEHLLIALTTWLKHKAIRRWRDQSHLKAIQLQKSSQNKNSQVFDSLNQDLGKVVKKHNELQQCNQNYQRELTAQAQRILANTFARYYYIKAERGIKKWIDVVKYQKHQEQILKTIVNHQRKNQMYFVKAAFQNWVSKSKIQEHRLMIKQTVIKTEEAIQMNTYKRDQSETICITQMADLRNNQRNTQQLNNQLQKILACIIRKNDDNYFQGYLRNIFTQWAAYTKRQVKFIKAITTTISKSMWQNGFTNIRAFSNDKHLTRVQNKHLVGMRRMFWKKNCQDAFNKWRNYQYKVVNADRAKTQMVNETETQNHNQFVNRTKDWTMIKGASFMRRIRLINLLQAWKNVTKWQIAARTQRLAFIDNSGTSMAKRSLKLWNNCQKYTVKYRSIMVKFNYFKRRLMMNAVFNAIKNRNYQNRNFVEKLGNIVAKFDNRMSESSLHMIRDFVASKISTNQQKQAIAARQLSQNLNQLYITRMTDNLNTLRCKVRSQKHRELILSSMFGHWYSRGLRETFQTWKQQALKAKVVEDVNDEGPIVEEVLNEQQKYLNLQNFMDVQGYTRKEIDEVKIAVEAKAKESLARVIQRMRHFTKVGDAYLLPKMFDRWRMFVKIRKLVGYLLRNLENKLKPVKADLSVAFNRWKKHQSNLQSGVDRGLLIAKCSNLERQSDQLLKLDDSASQFLHQMEIQRDELIENYIKGQRMAISLQKNNKQKAEHKALQKLSDNVHNHKKYNYEMILQRNISLIQSLKDRIKDFENDNDSLASENEELRQFSLDGYQIAKNVQNLSSERESLSIDLADKSRTIQKLLDQNQDLSLQLRDAQAYAIMLINQSNYNMRQLQQHR